MKKNNNSNCFIMHGLLLDSAFLIKKFSLDSINNQTNFIKPIILKLDSGLEETFRQIKDIKPDYLDKNIKLYELKSKTYFFITDNGHLAYFDMNKSILKICFDKNARLCTQVEPTLAWISDYVLMLLGAIILHASSGLINNRVQVFLGSEGAGKSMSIAKAIKKSNNNYPYSNDKTALFLWNRLIFTLPRDFYFKIKKDNYFEGLVKEKKIKKLHTSISKEILYCKKIISIKKSDLSVSRMTILTKNKQVQDFIEYPEFLEYLKLDVVRLIDKFKKLDLIKIKN